MPNDEIPRMKGSSHEKARRAIAVVEAHSDLCIRYLNAHAATKGIEVPFPLEECDPNASVRELYAAHRELMKLVRNNIPDIMNDPDAVLAYRRFLDEKASATSK